MQLTVTPEAAHEYVDRVVDLLGRPDTLVYFDTSFLMWLTTIGPLSRGQFETWASAQKCRMHVPLWTMHEYHRHHASRTLKARIDRVATKLDSSAKRFASELRPYADGALLAGRPQGAFREVIDAVLDSIGQLTLAAKSGWDYEGSAADVLRWMNRRPCDTAVVFESLKTLMSNGAARFTQDVPPGFLDRHKRDKPRKGSNRYGDLLFWEEVLHHSAFEQAAAVVIVTNDRKADWYEQAGEPAVGPEWKRLRKWKPVPAPHPTMAFEMNVRNGIRQLVMLDQLYLGAILWKTGRPQFERLAGVAIDVDPVRFAPVATPLKPIAIRAGKRLTNSTIGLTEALKLATAAMDVPDQATEQLLAGMDGDAPGMDAFVNTFGPQRLAPLSLGQIAAFSRLVHDRAIASDGPARVLAASMLDMLDELDADRAATAYLGLAISTYFDGGHPRPRPLSPMIKALFEWQIDTALPKVLQALQVRLRRARSTALYIPNGKPARVKALLDHDTDAHQKPVALRQLYFEGKALLTEVDPASDRLLTGLVGGAAQSKVGTIVQAACSFYGVPLELTDIQDCDPDELRTISPTLGFLELDRFTDDADEVDDEELDDVRHAEQYDTEDHSPIDEAEDDV